MAANMRKRLRDTFGADDVTSIRAALALRADATPSFWLHPAARAGASGADAFLVHLGQSIAAALQSLAESAEAARAHLSSTRSSLHAAVDARFDELLVSIDTAEAFKAASLERELVAVDAALDRWRAESAAVREAASSLADADLELEYDMLSCRLADAEAQLQMLKTAIVEPPFVGFSGKQPPLLLSIASFGRVLAPLAVAASDLWVAGLPRRRLSENTLCLCLSLDARLAAQTAEEFEVSMLQLAGATHVEATLAEFGVEPLPLRVTFAPCIAQSCVIVSLESPRSFGDAKVNVSSICVAGNPLAGFPRVLPVGKGIAAPLKLKSSSNLFSVSACITAEGKLYCRAGPTLQVFDSCGAPLPALPVASYGFADGTCSVTYSHGDVPSLVLSDASSLVAVDAVTRAARWSVNHVNYGPYHDAAALPALGVVIVSSTMGFHVHRLADGICVGSPSLSCIVQGLVSDPATGALYGAAPGANVHAWSYSSTETTVSITAHGTLALPKADLLALVPPAPGKRVAHLVAGSYNSNEIFVISLPGLSLVHTHKFNGLKVSGLAAEPLGGAIAVCDLLSTNIHVMTWPLPGMPPIE